MSEPFHDLGRVFPHAGQVAASGVTDIPPVVALVIGTVPVREPMRGLDASGPAGHLRERIRSAV